jgi:hypothetical protein
LKIARPSRTRARWRRRVRNARCNGAARANERHQRRAAA